MMTDNVTDHNALYGIAFMRDIWTFTVDLTQIPQIVEHQDRDLEV